MRKRQIVGRALPGDGAGGQAGCGKGAGLERGRLYGGHAGGAGLGAADQAGIRDTDREHFRGDREPGGAGEGDGPAGQGRGTVGQRAAGGLRGGQQGARRRQHLRRGRGQRGDGGLL